MRRGCVLNRRQVSGVLSLKKSFSWRCLCTYTSASIRHVLDWDFGSEGHSRVQSRGPRHRHDHVGWKVYDLGVDILQSNVCIRGPGLRTSYTGTKLVVGSTLLMDKDFDEIWTCVDVRVRVEELIKYSYDKVLVERMTMITPSHSEILGPWSSRRISQFVIGSGPRRDCDTYG